MRAALDLKRRPIIFICAFYVYLWDPSSDEKPDFSCSGFPKYLDFYENHVDMCSRNHLRAAVSGGGIWSAPPPWLFRYLDLRNRWRNWAPGHFFRSVVLSLNFEGLNFFKEICNPTFLFLYITVYFMYWLCAKFWNFRCSGLRDTYFFLEKYLQGQLINKFATVCAALKCVVFGANWLCLSQGVVYEHLSAIVPYFF